MNQEPTTRDLKIFAEQNREAIEVNRQAIERNSVDIQAIKKKLEEHDRRFDRIEERLDQQSNTMVALVEAINVGFDRLAGEIRDHRESTERMFEKAFSGINENRYRLDGHEKRIELLENKAS